MERKNASTKELAETALKLKESKQSVILLRDENVKLSCKLIASEKKKMQSRLLAAESLLSEEKKQCEVAEESLKREKLVSKRLRDQMYYYRQQLQNELEWRTKQRLISSYDMDHLCERIEAAFGLMKGA